jgi:pyruvate dehydrogenase E1 component alpha subunit/2-oxoisovalerate dehydrogenase E1 component alpha subunit
VALKARAKREAARKPKERASARPVWAEKDRPAVARDEGLWRVVDDEGAVVGEVPEISAARLAHLYRHMLQLRLLDERMMILQRQGRVGFYGTCNGQEAATLASTLALEPEDWIFPALREAAAMLLRGFDLVPYLCQVFGNAGDVTKGRQMPSHQAARSVNQVSWGSCIGSQLPQAVGAAMAMRVRGDRKVAMGFIGDGGTASADFHAAMNFAGVYKPPIVIVCQNNHWSISTPTSRQSASRTIAVKARAYGFPGVRVDGNDALAVYAACKEAVDRARAGGGPTFVEALTYRIGAHSSSDDPRVYRDEREVEVWKRKDPLMRLRAFMTGRGLMDDARHELIREELDGLILAAVDKAERIAPPAPETLFDDVYVDAPWQVREQRAELLAESAGE